VRTIDLKIGDVGITHGPVAGADLPTIATEQRNAPNIFWTDRKWFESWWMARSLPTKKRLRLMPRR
jgi:hypothetical protein